MTLSKLDPRCSMCPDRNTCTNKTMCACAEYVPQTIVIEGAAAMEKDVIKNILKNMNKIGGLYGSKTM